MKRLKWSSKNQIVLPREAREAMRVRVGDELVAVVKGKVTLLMAKPKNYLEELSGLGRGVYSKRYLKKERRLW